MIKVLLAASEIVIAAKIVTGAASDFYKHCKETKKKKVKDKD